ncbi:hypothetical protein PCC7424_4143 [Gloeothece citriformis PCC 7424]|uniref:Uncharacterized protein n=1 Tax=Gloeothece citriformis (strain PCC 7424) TaxID=65393 RepID=B7KLE2_GLOC7|nr:hypothetical protein [Gloeothece citriformis]ACK72514.1 hypothetical protein PCC7424_4143 [Gloeothece citriformis PCC 7424]
MSSFKKNPNKKRGGTRENAGRKSIWINQDTCTIRVPKIFAARLHEIAQKWDKEEFNDFVSKSNSD